MTTSEQPEPAGGGATTQTSDTARPSRMSRLWSAVLGLWGAVIGVAPHVLHHVGPLAGAALLAGTGGTLLFAGIALVVSIPFLIRIYRRFHTWVAPAIALVIMAAMFTLSTMVIGPTISGNDGDAPVPQPDIEHSVPDEHGH